MFSNSILPSFPYPPPQEGYWNPVTSTINWCEEDYYATIYSAEIVNTLTNLLFMALGIKGIRSCLKYQHDTIFLVSYIGYLLVVSGSFAFHSTLKYPWQLVDELSMIYTTSLMAFAVFSFDKSQLYRIMLAVGLVGLDVFITAYYHHVGNPDFHQNCFALLAVVVVFRSIYLMEVNIRPSFRAKYATAAKRKIHNPSSTESERAANDMKDNQTLREMWLMVILGLSVFLGGFGIWTLDNSFCSTIRHWRREIGLPWGILLEGHGWWHLMTGTGAYFYVVWAIWLRHCLNNKNYVLYWPSMFFSLPEVVPAKVASFSHGKGANGRMENGHGTNLNRKSI